MADVYCTVIYKSIDGFPGYRVGNDGSVWTNHKRTTAPGLRDSNGDRWHLLSPDIGDNGGHMRVTLCRDGRTFRKLVHHLVLEAFVGPRPHRAEACHDPDNDPSNNHLANLRWGTRAENRSDRKRQGSYLNGTFKRGELHCNRKLTPELVRSIRAARDSGVTYQALADQFGVCKKTIGLVIRRKAWARVA